MSKTLYIFLLLLIFSACKTTRHTQSEINSKVSPKTLITNASDLDFVFDQFSSKTKIKVIEEGKKTDFKANLRLKKDSLIWVSVTPIFGIEVARAQITPDSIMLLDRIHKVYYSKPFSYLADMYELPVDFYRLQKLIVGGLLNQNIEKKHVNTKNGSYIIKTTEQNVTISTNIDPRHYYVNSVLMKETPSNRELNILFDEYEEIEGQQFASKREIDIRGEENVKMNLEFSRIKINKPLVFTFVVNDKYERIN